MGIKERIFGIIEEDVSDSLLHKIFEVFIVTLIILNIIVIILESSLKSESILFGRFELFSVVIFTLEYLLRLWTSDIKYRNASGFHSRIKFIFSVSGMVDLIAILPFYAALFLPFAIDGRMFRMLRLLRLLPILKLYRFLESFALIRKVIRSRRYELLITGFVAFMVIVVASTLMYELEHDAQPDKFPDVISAFWWAIATLTTIGYGDIYPVTGPGKLVSALISLVGIGLIALPTGILSTSFIEEFRSKNTGKSEITNIGKSEVTSTGYETAGPAQPEVCPHCGRNLKE